MKNLSIHTDYHENDKVAIENGQGLNISKSGSSIVQTSSAEFRLHNILHVLDISSNLLSVNQFAKDND